MSVLRTIGLNDYTLTGTRKAWNRDLGRTTVKTYKGPIEKVDDFFESMVDDVAIDGMIERKGDGVAFIDVTFVDDTGEQGPVTGDLNETWECMGQDLFKSIRTHETFNQDADQLNLEHTRLWFESGHTRGVAPAAAPETTYLKLLQQGTDEYVRSTAVLRQSLIAGPRSLLEASWEDVDRAITFSEVGFVQTGQGNILGDLSNMPDWNAAKKQWLKRAPTIQTNGKRRFDLQQEYWFARRWSATLYDGDVENGNP